MQYEPQITMGVTATNNKLSVSLGGHSEAGIKDENQDAFAALVTKGNERIYKGIVATLADGCSSARHARQASLLAVNHFIAEYLETPDSWSVHKSASKVLAGLNQWMFSQTPHVTSIGGYHQADWLTTFSAIILKSTTGYIFHVGDSRISRLREGSIEPLTREHLVNRSLTRALGAETHLEVDAYKVEVRKGDLFILTSDGVHDVLSNSQLRQLISSKETLEEAAKVISNKALEQGSTDNVTCLLVRVDDLPYKQLDELYNELTRRKIPPALKVGQKIDGYRVIRELHASNRSHLYLVQSSSEEAPVVLKAPSQNFAEDPIYLQGFLREAWAGKRLNHPNVMKVLSTAEQSKFLYHICEYVDGQTLSCWMHDSPHPDISQVRNIIEQMIQALRAFQRLDMVHRDLKPDNVMINQHGQVKLIDYGTVAIASLKDKENQFEEQCPQGSANYIAPETLLEMKTDFRSDLFSLGVIGYQLLSGQLPYKPQSNDRFIPSDYQHWRYRSIKQFRNSLPVWLDLALERAVSPRPDQRYQAYSEFLADISRPNLSAVQAHRNAPLLEREPVKVWQFISLILFILLILK